MPLVHSTGGLSRRKFHQRDAPKLRVILTHEADYPSLNGNGLW